MPTYELSLVVKQALKRPDMVAAVKRTGENVLNNGGYIRNLEFLGHRNLPQRQKANDEYHTKGSYFVMKIDVPKSGESKDRESLRLFAESKALMTCFDLTIFFYFGPVCHIKGVFQHKF